MEKKGALIIGVSIIIGFLVLGYMVKSPLDKLGEGIIAANNIEQTKLDNVDADAESNRYQMVSANENNIMLLDTKTGEYWRKFVPNSKGPTYWTKEAGPEFDK